MTTARFQIARHECIDLLESHVVGRLCVIDSEYPLAFPVNYRVVRAEQEVSVIVQAAPSAAIARYEGPASIEVDQIDLATGTAWSLIARGRLSRVLGAHDLPPTEPLVSTGRTQWIRLDVVAISGRRFRVKDVPTGIGWVPATADD